MNGTESAVCIFRMFRKGVHAIKTHTFAHIRATRGCEWRLTATLYAILQSLHIFLFLCIGTSLTLLHHPTSAAPRGDLSI